MLYIITISAAVVLIALFNFAFSCDHTAYDFFWPLLCAFIGAVVVILIDGLLAFIARRMPEKYFSPEAKAFGVPDWEIKLYKKLGVKNWNKFVPELGCFTGFHKDKISNPFESKYLARFLIESNYGVLGHILGTVLGFSVILLCFVIPGYHPLTIGLPVAIVNMVLSHLPTMILRNNTPSLRSLYRRCLKREEKAKEQK